MASAAEPSSSWPCLHTLPLRGKLVSFCTFSYRGHLAIAGAKNGKVGIYNAQTGEYCLTLHGHNERVISCAFKPDGSLLATASEDRTVRIWNPYNAECQNILGCADDVSCCAFSPDGSLLATASQNNTVNIWDAKKSAYLCDLEGHNEVLTFCAFSSTGLLATTSKDNTAKIWDVRRRECLLTLKHNTTVTRCAFSFDGNLLATVSENNTVQIWEVRTGCCLRTLREHSSIITSCVFSCKDLLATASHDKTVKVWDPYTGECLHTQPHDSAVFSCSFSKDGDLLATTVEDAIKIWNVPSDCGIKPKAIATPLSLLPCFPPLKQGYINNCLSPNGALSLTVDTDNMLRLWNVATGHCIAVWKSKTKCIKRCIFSPDSTLLAIVDGSLFSSINIRNSWNGADITTLDCAYDSISSCAFSPDSTLLVTIPHISASGAGAEPRLWNPRSGISLGSLRGHSHVTHCAISPTGIVATASVDHTVRLWNTKIDECRASLPPHSSVESCAFNSDGAVLVTASYDGTARLWDAGTGICLHTLRAHTFYVESCTFSPYSTLVATVSGDKTARLWRVDTGECLAVLENVEFASRSQQRPFNFSSDGSLVMIGNQCWSIPPKFLMKPGALILALAARRRGGPRLPPELFEWLLNEFWA